MAYAVPPELRARIQRTAKRIYRTLGLDGYARIDFRMTDDFTPYCLEANTLPGMPSGPLPPIWRRRRAWERSVGTISAASGCVP